MTQAFRYDPNKDAWVPLEKGYYDRERKQAAKNAVLPSVRRKELEEYAARVDVIGETARNSLNTVLKSDLQYFMQDMSEADWKELRELLIDDLYETRSYWSDASGFAACEFYDSIITNRSTNNLFRAAQLPDQVSRKACADAVRNLAKHLFDGNIDKFVEKICDNAQNGVRAYANRTIMINCKRDKIKGVMYARVPVGAETCAFCMMLASRGFVYYSKESAGDNGHMHPHCDCKIVPGFSGDSIEGYWPDVYRDFYKENNNGKGVNDTLNNMRRVLYPIHSDHINEVKRNWWSRSKDEQNAKRRKVAAQKRDNTNSSNAL